MTITQTELLPPPPVARSRKPVMKASEILTALRRHHGILRDWPMGVGPWALLEEFPIGVAFKCESRIDALAVRTGGDMERIAYEVKVSRSDLLKELKFPGKRFHAERVCNRWVLATPPGLVRPGELPEGAGLVEIHTQGVRWIEQGTKTAAESPAYFVASLARRASRAEEQLRRSSLVAL